MILQRIMDIWGDIIVFVFCKQPARHTCYTNDNTLILLGCLSYSHIEKIFAYMKRYLCVVDMEVEITPY